MAVNFTLLLHDDADAFVPARAASLARLRGLAADPANLPRGLTRSLFHTIDYTGGMLPRSYEGQVCSVARTLEVVGDRWTLLVVREALTRTRRFEDFRTHLGIAHNVLSDRLARLVEAGVLERELYQTRPDRYEYRLTQQGLALWPVVMSLLMWGDRYRSPDGPPLLTRHHGCGGRLTPNFTCDTCGETLGPADVELLPGPGAASDA